MYESSGHVSPLSASQIKNRYFWHTLLPRFRYPKLCMYLVCTLFPVILINMQMNTNSSKKAWKMRSLVKICREFALQLYDACSRSRAEMWVIVINEAEQN